MPYTQEPKPEDLVGGWYNIPPAAASLYCRGLSPGLGMLDQCRRAFLEARPKFWTPPAVAPEHIEAVLDRFAELAVAAYKLPPDRQRAADALTKPGLHHRLAPNPRLAGLLDLLDQAAAEQHTNQTEESKQGK